MSTAGVKYYVTVLIKDTFDKACYAFPFLPEAVS